MQCKKDRRKNQTTDLKKHAQQSIRPSYFATRLDTLLASTIMDSHNARNNDVLSSANLSAISPAYQGSGVEGLVSADVVPVDARTPANSLGLTLHSCLAEEGDEDEDEGECDDDDDEDYEEVPASGGKGKGTRKRKGKGKTTTKPKAGIIRGGVGKSGCKKGKSKEAGIHEFNSYALKYHCKIL